MAGGDELIIAAAGEETIEANLRLWVKWQIHLQLGPPQSTFPIQTARTTKVLKMIKVFMLIRFTLTQLKDVQGLM
jgi:hypothetical protein